MTTEATLVRRFAANTQGRDLVVGDVHGCVSKLLAALDDVGFDPAAGDRLFLLGDLVDRGPESERVLELLQTPGVFSVMGNHEEMALAYAAGMVDAGFYAANGGAWFISKTEAERRPFIDAFLALPVAIELETAAGLLGLVHADCPDASWPSFTARLQGFAGRAEAAHVQAMALWARTRIDHRLQENVAGVRAVLVGHTPVERLITLGNVHFLDFGAWLDGGETWRGFAIVDAASLLSAHRPLPGAAVAA